MTDQADRDEAERLKALLNSAARLPRSIEPPVDQWPGIRARIDEARVVPIHPNATPGSNEPAVARTATRRYIAVAAAVLVIAGAAYLSRGSFNETETPQLAATVAAPLVVAPPTAGLPANTGNKQIVRSRTVSGHRAGDATHVMSAFDAYEDAARDLSSSLNARRSQLDPKTLAVLDTCMKQIDNAIAEARAALGRNPGSEIVTDFLRSSYRQKLDLLKRTVEGPRRTL